MSSTLPGAAAIVGIGQTEFSKESGRSELQLACEAVSAALDDAGLAPADVDGMVTFTMDSSDEIDIARNVGIGDLSFFSRVHHGGGAAAGTVVHAAMAVATGVADVVVCWRAFNERSGFRFGGSGRTSAETPLFMAHYAPFGLLTPAAWVALHAQRYMSTYGVTNEHFGRIAVVDRAHAARNPDAWFYERPITLGGPPEFALDHRTRAAPAGLLPGERRRCRAGDHQRRTRARPAAAPGHHRRGGTGRGRQRRDDDQLLPRRHHRASRDGRRRRPALA